MLRGTPRTLRLLRAAVCCASLFAACVAEGCAVDGTANEALATTTGALTVDQEIARATCSTSSSVVLGLSQQILDEIATCLKPGVLVKVAPEAKIAVPSTHPYLIKPAYDALRKAAASRTDSINVSSMFRTVAQQYFLWRRSDCYPAVAAPGSSNHETGIAIDVSDPDNTNWRTALTNVGFKWLGSFDRFHFDYVGAGSVNLRGQDVVAFQRLWNRNNPADKIGEDGSWGPQTEARLKISPAGGFPIGAQCAPPAPTTKPWPKLEVDADADGTDRFSDGPSAAVVDVMESDEYVVNLVVRNVGDAIAKDVILGVWVEDPFVSAVHYDIETDWNHPGTFEISDANARMDNPPHDAPGKDFAVKINAVSPKETKRLRMKVKGARYSIGAADAPDVRVWVKDVPGVYTKTDFASAPTNVEGRQTANGGDLKAWAPVDIYSRIRWSFDAGMLEGWTEGGAAEANAEGSAKTLVLTAKGDDPQLLGPETSFDAAAYPGITIKAASALAGPARVYFTTEAAPTFDESRAVEFTLPSGSTPADVLVRLADNPLYRGTITRLRIDPAPTGNGAVVFDDIRMSDAPKADADAGPLDDGGIGATPEEETAGSCACKTQRPTSTHRSERWWAVLALALIPALRRRGARHAAAQPFSSRPESEPESESEPGVSLSS